MTLSIARGATATALSPRELRTLQDSWRRDHCVVLPHLFDRTFVHEVRREIRECGTFTDYSHPASGVEKKLTRTGVVWLLDFLMNDPRILAAVGAITGVAVTWFYGRIYQLTPGTLEAHDWHDDLNETRRLGVSINLTDGVFEGGDLQLRDAESRRLLAVVGNRGEGDGVIFRLGADIQHRVLPVTGTVPRVAYAGWFHVGPTLRDRLLQNR